MDGMDEDVLLADLGLGAEGRTDVADHNGINVLHHVRSSVEKRTAEEIADRTPCADFEASKPLFKQVEQDLKSEVRRGLRFGHPVRPRERFLVPLHVIDEAVECTRDGSITDAVYDTETARLVA